MIDEGDLAALTVDKAMLPVPEGWRRSATDEAMPDVVSAIRASRAGR